MYPSSRRGSPRRPIHTTARRAMGIFTTWMKVMLQPARHRAHAMPLARWLWRARIIIVDFTLLFAASWTSPPSMLRTPPQQICMSKQTTTSQQQISSYGLAGMPGQKHFAATQKPTSTARYRATSMRAICAIPPTAGPKARTIAWRSIPTGSIRTETPSTSSFPRRTSTTAHRPIASMSSGERRITVAQLATPTSPLWRAWQAARRHLSALHRRPASALHRRLASRQVSAHRYRRASHQV